MTKDDAEIKVWSNGIAELIVDAMLDSKLVRKEDFKKAVDVVAEEIFVRLIMGDYPPPCDSKQLLENT